MSVNEQHALYLTLVSRMVTARPKMTPTPVRGELKFGQNYAVSADKKLKIG